MLLAAQRIYYVHGEVRTCRTTLYYVLSGERYILYRWHLIAHSLRRGFLKPVVHGPLKRDSVHT